MTDLEPLRELAAEFRARAKKADNIASRYVEVEDISRAVALSMTWAAAAAEVEGVLRGVEDAS